MVRMSRSLFTPYSVKNPRTDFYLRAKHVQLINKDPIKAISFFRAAINSGDRVDSALKDMSMIMKQLDRVDEAIEAITSYRHLCSSSSQDSLDSILADLYKVNHKSYAYYQLEEGIAFGGQDRIILNPRTGIRRCPPTLGKVPELLVKFIYKKDVDSVGVTLQRKLLNNLDMVQKVVMNELSKLKKTPFAKEAERRKRVRPLMSMREFEMV